jgi:DNA-binding LacI/PurR family transcriptional regulator
MIRLKDIAERAGVSVMTVSKVMRDAQDISADTKGRIRSLAQQMGYVPDSMAQGLRTRRTKLLGLLIPSITNPNFVRFLLAVEESAFNAGYELIIAHTLNQPDREETLIRRLLARRVDGLMIMPVYRPDNQSTVYQDLTRRATPTVIIGQKPSFCSSFKNVEVDDLKASYEITKHLLSLGHKRIAFFAGPPFSPWAQERLEGYKKALNEALIPLDDRLIFNAGNTLEEGEATALQLLNESPQATAIQAVSDLVAMGAGNVLLNKGLRIPNDYSLVGFGNVLAAEFFRVPLTTVRLPKYRLGIAAMDLLLQLLRGESVSSKKMPSEIIASIRSTLWKYLKKRSSLP